MVQLHIGLGRGYDVRVVTLLGAYNKQSFTGRYGGHITVVFMNGLEAPRLDGLGPNNFDPRIYVNPFLNGAYRSAAIDLFGTQTYDEIAHGFRPFVDVDMTAWRTMFEKLVRTFPQAAQYEAHGRAADH